MFEIILSYFVYNLILGAFLTVFYLFTRNGELGAKHIIWLLLFPAAGLGNWRFKEAQLLEGTPAFPEKWFMWKYMIKVNWGYMGLLGIIPVTGTLLMVFGLYAFTFEGFSGFESLIEGSIILVFLLVLLVTVFLLIFPFLILILFPIYQKRRIERNQYYEALNDRLASEPSNPKVPTRKPIALIPGVETYASDCLVNFSTIDKQRKKDLEIVANYVAEKAKLGETANLTFICTHNSRRSQFGQVWAAVAAAKFGVGNVQTFSGGTEETAFNKRAVEACKRAGLKIEGTVGTNPRYSVRFSDSVGALDCYSKTFDNPSNPQLGFAAIMTCSDADENCPIIHGAEFRASLTYDDPKVADRTAEETAKYDERCKQIATEMLYLFSKI
ncbi:MAG: hypothetical protein ACPGD8_09000 [Flavobacteriales bacterium]